MLRRVATHREPSIFVDVHGNRNNPDESAKRNGNGNGLMLNGAVKPLREVAGVQIEKVHWDVGDENVCEWHPGGKV